MSIDGNSKRQEKDMPETATEIVPERMARFGEIYTDELRKARASKPSDYFWPESDLPKIAAKMLDAVERGSFLKDSPSFKATFRKLGIKHTYKACAAWLRGKDGE